MGCVLNMQPSFFSDVARHAEDVVANSFLDLAADTLGKAASPLTYQDVWQLAETLGLTAKLKTGGKTPWNSMGAQLYVDVRDNPQSVFVKLGKRPAKFFLKARVGELKSVGADDSGLVVPGVKSAKYKERDVHPVLAYFAFASPGFNRGRAVITKTIYHEKSKKSGYSEWNHPDMVGFSIPIEDWHPDVLELNGVTDRNALTLFSFELKKHISRATYRESFFQAVSNSSWAHQGYLVAAEIDEDDDLLAELERLASSFGIGIIHLDLRDFGQSRVVHPARTREALDWETINKLCEQNEDFQRFLENVKIDFTARKVHRGEYDVVLQEIDNYLAGLLKG
ncbi:MAG: HTH domain-containing protein [Planctomycetaceae bacterium]